MTTIYVFMICALQWGRLNEISRLSLNEFGDFFAGVVGPIAIFWLILGYFQQGHELRNSVDTLKLQAKELAASVEQQRELVQVTREQLAHDAKLMNLQLEKDQLLDQPTFMLGAAEISSSNNRTKYTLNLINSESSVSNLEISIPDHENNKTLYAKPIFSNEESVSFRISFEDSEIFQDRPLKISFQTRSGINGIQIFYLSKEIGRSAILVSRDFSDC